VKSPKHNKKKVLYSKKSTMLMDWFEEGEESDPP
jgi:hypothetical protein